MGLGYTQFIMGVLLGKTYKGMRGAEIRRGERAERGWGFWYFDLFHRGALEGK